MITTNSTAIQLIDFPKLDRYKIISFDIFDTSVFRQVFEPKDLFLLMEEELVEKYGNPFLGFSDRRFQAELETCKRTWKGDRSAEFQLEDIYEVLFFSNPDLAAYAHELKQMELRLESSVIVPNCQVLDYFLQARRLGKETIFVSDIYLPKNHIEKILAASGYTGYSELFVSCDVGSNKASGALYDVVLQKMQVKPEEILHIGDNGYSDIIQAQSKGIHTCQVPNPKHLLDASRYSGNSHQKYTFRTTASESLLKGIQKNYLLNGNQHKGQLENTGYDIGYQILGPICYGFANWIIRHCQQQQIKQLYFVAREGWFLKQVFDEVNQAAKTDITSHYFYASRRALYMPFLTQPVSDFLFPFLISKKAVPLSSYLNALELKVDDARLRELGFQSRDEVISPKQNASDWARLKALFEAEAEQIEAIAKEEKENYLDYLEQSGMFSTEQIGLVDSGWFGNGQNRLRRLIKLRNPNAKLFGFYLALHEKAKANLDEQSFGHGYLYQFDDFNGDIETFLEVARLVEVFLSAPSESLKKFGRQNGDLHPVFMKATGESKLHPTLEAIHAGALNFVRDFANGPLENLPALPGHVAANLLNQFLQDPTQVEAATIGNLPYETNTVATDGAKFASPQVTLTDFFKHPPSVVREFSATHWRIAYYKNHQSPLIKFFLRSTQRYFWSRDALLSRVYSFGRRAHRKLKSRTTLISGVWRNPGSSADAPQSPSPAVSRD